MMRYIITHAPNLSALNRRENMSKFIGYTSGLDCNGHGKVGKLVKVEYKRLDNGDVRLGAVSGHNLGALGHYSTVTAEQFDNRPGAGEVGGNVAEARWALGIVGYTLMSEDVA